MKNNNTIYQAMFILAISWFSITDAHANNQNQNQAKAYYFAAEESYENKKYDTALKSIKKVEALLGKSNAALSALRVKVLVGQRKYQEAKAEIDLFYGYNAKKALAKEMASYLIKIDEGIEQKIAKEKEQVRQVKLAKERELENQRKAPFIKLNELYEDFLSSDKITNELYSKYAADFPEVVNRVIDGDKLAAQKKMLDAEESACGRLENGSVMHVYCSVELPPVIAKYKRQKDIFDRSQPFAKKISSWVWIREQRIREQLDICNNLIGTPFEIKIKSICDDMKLKYEAYNKI